YTQSDYAIRCEWGEEGITRLSLVSDVVIIVDVLSFSTAVAIAVQNGAVIFPYPAHDDTAVSYAQSVQAMLAQKERTVPGFSLSPASLQTIPAGTRLVLPSPNGAALTRLSRAQWTLTGGLVNAAAVAAVAEPLGERIAIIPAGE